MQCLAKIAGCNEDFGSPFRASEGFREGGRRGRKPFRSGLLQGFEGLEGTVGIDIQGMAYDIYLYRMLILIDLKSVNRCKSRQ